MQAKLLRVLLEQEIERVGDPRPHKISVRIIAATNRDLKQEVAAGRFREDLFYRLSVFPIEIPPLRSRREDLPSLVAHFVRQSAQRINCPVPRISQATMHQLTAYDWPGNVRELQNAIERAVILSRGGPLHFEPAVPPPPLPRIPSLPPPPLPTSLRATTSSATSARTSSPPCARPTASFSGSMAPPLCWT
jgi:DNA-binding NtrC family response regulator